MYPNSASLGVAVPTARVSQIEEQMTSLHINAQDLANIVETIEQKLTSVTAPFLNRCEPQPVPEPVLVPLAASIKSANDSFRNSVDRLRQLNGSIELS